MAQSLDRRTIHTHTARPATRNGDPVALQTVVMIPFRPMRKSGF
jgi:hypothetical protein